ncbi:5-oxoprolinase subunit PxpA [Alkalimonas delamerensis]|uniref:5-oxoprolinase subunit PxpA n=1 Tax=Alkalimonas delamerensis TaxID=265981 RepID=A0ABT9GMM1_9GAMM|nr:5-oxoprolinase subunit PxpA [Alkalimonas delamerensis]MDP4528214.1 5-oxoprolinase subunit PxpA [Alkalimonas delamerensis]
MKLNCDLGESYGSWTMGMDSSVMPYIDMANIACGFHAGDADVMQRTLALAKHYRVEVGAHPSYPDRQGFGRRSMNCSAEELVNLLHYQIAALDGMAQIHGLELSYVKPHGALYNDMMHHPAILETVFTAIKSYHKPLALMLLATAEQAKHQAEADALGISLLFEAFADRRYTDAGLLMPRSKPGAVLNQTEVMTQVQLLVDEGVVITDSGKRLALQADTLCVHGDNEAAIAEVKHIRQLLQG